jgi:hypothetical protein
VKDPGIVRYPTERKYVHVNNEISQYVYTCKVLGILYIVGEGHIAEEKQLLLPLGQ